MMSGGYKKLGLILLCVSIGACDSQKDKPVEAPLAEGQSAKQSQASVASREEVELKRRDELVRQALVGSQFEESTAPLKVSYQAQVNRVLSSERPVLALNGLEDPNSIKAQTLVLDDPELLKALFHPKTKQPLRNEVMSVKPALPGDRVGAAQKCKLGECYRVDIYNFFYNVTVTAIADVVNGEVIVINSLPETQPDLSPRLEKLAEAIAKHEPLVQAEVARYLKSITPDKPVEEPLPVMVSTKSALKNSLCERSRHLCVAPTYVLGSQALWVIVDLTDFRVVGVRWTTVGESGPPTIITERKLENEYVFSNFCEKTTPLTRNGWSLSYHLTTSDGLRVADVVFNDKPVFESAKVVDWHVSYSKYDGFGYSDATGCPMFSSAVVVAYDGPEITPIIENDVEVGFAISQDFRQLPWPAACNYRYEERYEFYNDGRYRVALSNHGRGCGVNGTYRPVLRIDLGRQAPQNNYTMQAWEADDWNDLTSEMWSKQPEKSQMQSQRYSHRIVNGSGSGYLLAPSIGEFGDGGRGDSAFIYTTVRHDDKDEGRSDLVTLGSCCNEDYQQGPEQFMQPAEDLAGQDIVLWYVPQMQNDNTQGNRYCWAETQVVAGVHKTKTWPCTSGPMFVPIE